MGTVTLARRADGNFTPAQLQVWFNNQLVDMAEYGGTDDYCGNWNACTGLHIVNQPFKDRAAANAYAETNAEKNGSVLAMRVGDTCKAWPVTKAQKDLRDRLAKLETEANEFEYRILERAQAQKSKKKTCSHCDSNINVHAICKPALSQLKTSNGRFDGDLFYVRGRHMMASLFGMTDCPICAQNLLKTETDDKNEASLKKRLSEAATKVRDSKAAFAKENAGTPEPFWLVYGECGE